MNVTRIILAVAISPLVALLPHAIFFGGASGSFDIFLITTVLGYSVSFPLLICLGLPFAFFLKRLTKVKANNFGVFLIGIGTAVGLMMGVFALPYFPIRPISEFPSVQQAIFFGMIPGFLVSLAFYLIGFRS